MWQNLYHWFPAVFFSVSLVIAKVHLTSGELIAAQAFGGLYAVVWLGCTCYAEYHAGPDGSMVLPGIALAVVVTSALAARWLRADALRRQKPAAAGC